MEAKYTEKLRGLEELVLVLIPISPTTLTIIFLQFANWFGMAVRLPALLTSMVIDVLGEHVK